MRKYNLIVMADHNIGFALVEFILKSNCHNILAVYTNKKEGIEWWKNIFDLQYIYPGIPFREYRDAPNILKDITCLEQSIDIILLLSWKHLIPCSLIKKTNLGIVNLHYSLLPAYRGTYPNSWAIINGEEKTGITFHWIDDRIDHGDIIIQSEVNIEYTDTSKSLLHKLDRLALETFNEIWPNIHTWEENSTRQTENKNIYNSSQFKDNNCIDLNDNIKVIDFINLLRGKSFYPEYNNVYFIDPHDQKKIYINIFLDKEK
jgi:methionyl-tRNA formyltransferase